MIVPWLKGFLSWHRAPVTWTLIFLNFLFFGLTYEMKPEKSSSLVSKTEKLQLTGRLYDQYQHQFSKEYFQSSLKSPTDYLLIGSRGLRDKKFLEAAPDSEFFGDEIEIADWKKEIVSLRNQLQQRPSFKFGLVGSEIRPLTWITYQFMHAGWIHLLSNMFLLLIFAGALERCLGSLGLITIYILGGCAGALGYLSISAQFWTPMVGASGSLSAIMACYAAFEKKRRVPFFYFVSPIQNYYGLIYLPTLLIFPLCFLPDLSSLLSASAELGAGIAFSAHLGGALFGAIMGFGLRALEFRGVTPSHQS